LGRGFQRNDTVMACDQLEGDGDKVF
jgi:hypothetical protein